MSDKRKYAEMPGSHVATQPSKKRQPAIRIEERSTKYKPQARSLLSLPNELLLEIIGILNAERRFLDLLAMAFVCRRLSSVVQESVLRVDGNTRTLELPNTWTLVSTLLNDPVSANNVSHLRLNFMDHCAARELRKSDDKLRLQISRESYQTCCKMIKRLCKGQDTSAWQNAIMLEDNFLTSGLSILLAITPKLTELTIGTSHIEQIPLLANFFPPLALFMDPRHVPWYSQALSILISKLEVLDIRRDTENWQYWSHRNLQPRLQFEHFTSLKQLSAPVKAVVDSRSGVKSTYKLLDFKRELPRQLQYLRLYMERMSMDQKDECKDVIAIAEAGGLLKAVECDREDVAEFVVMPGAVR